MIRRPYWLVAAAALSLLAGCNVRDLATVVHDKGWSASERQEAHRPQLHYTPAENWMNDPNGLVFFDGEYHLFYQYNPEGRDWGNMSWGHAVSTDLVHWEELPLALPQQRDDNGTPGNPDDDRIESIFSGSVVVDPDNRSGLGEGTEPVLLAYYTSAYNHDAPGRGRQAQSLAYSTDRGRTWRFYPDNPILALAPDNPDGYNAHEFRDPKVFYYEPEDKWVMAVVLALDRKVRFYASTDLLNWHHLSDFGPANSDTGIWEMPDLFQVPVDSQPGLSKWVLALSVNGGTPYGGSGIQYFVGEFDGTHFHAENRRPRDPAGGTRFADFEQGFAGWDIQGDAFGRTPAPGTLTDRDGNPLQQPVSGYQGDRLVNTFRRFDRSVGIATSPSFTIGDPYINLLVGGGDHPDQGLARQGVIGYPRGQLFAAFDGPDWGDWQASGDAFTDARGQAVKSTFDGWYDLPGVLGTSLAHSFRPDAGGDAATGELISPTFTIERDFINFKIGGGYHPPNDPGGFTGLRLIVDGEVVRWATGMNRNQLYWRYWDLSEWRGQQAHLEILDRHGGSWGQIQVDHILFSDQRAPWLGDDPALLAGFDGPAYDGWRATGNAFDDKPASGGQGPVTNYLGNGLVHTFTADQGDAATGTLTSPTFVIERDYLNVLVGGGNKPAGHPDGEARVYLEVEGTEIASATGRDSPDMDWHSWDVSDHRGRTARVVISDQSTAGWGQVQVDHLVATDRPIGAPLGETSTQTAVNLKVNGEVVRSATGRNDERLDWAAWDVSELIGQQAEIEIVDLNRGAWGHILVDDIRFAREPAPAAPQRADWVDWGKDFYAGITFFDFPGNRPAWLAWSNNWQYAGDIPTEPFRGAQSVVRSLGLIDTADGWRLTQRPLGIDSLRIDEDALAWPVTARLDDEAVAFNHEFAVGSLLEVRLVLEPTSAVKSGLSLHLGETDRLELVYDRARETLALDRTASGAVDFSPDFPGVHAAPARLDRDGRLRLRLLLDWSLIEVFAQHGQVAITDRFFPDQDGPLRLKAFAREGEAIVHAFEVHRLSSIWAD